MLCCTEINALKSSFFRYYVLGCFHNVLSPPPKAMGFVNNMGRPPAAYWIPHSYTTGFHSLTSLDLKWPFTDPLMIYRVTHFHHTTSTNSKWAFTVTTTKSTKVLIIMCGDHGGTGGHVPPIFEKSPIDFDFAQSKFFKNAVMSPQYREQTAANVPPHWTVWKISRNSNNRKERAYILRIVCLQISLD